MVMFKSEASVVIDSFKYEFRKRYKNLDINVIVSDINNIVDAFHVNIIDVLNKEKYSFGIVANDFETYGEFRTLFILKIEKIIDKIIDRNYRR